ncbi:hypothetical protein RCL1_000993 [Eukaryota sp. TZLM3-RCL]
MFQFYSLFMLSIAEQIFFQYSDISELLLFSPQFESFLRDVGLDPTSDLVFYTWLVSTVFAPRSVVTLTPKDFDHAFTTLQADSLESFKEKVSRVKAVVPVPIPTICPHCNVKISSSEVLNHLFYRNCEKTLIKCKKCLEMIKEDNFHSHVESCKVLKPSVLLNSDLLPLTGVYLASMDVPNLPEFDWSVFFLSEVVYCDQTFLVLNEQSKIQKLSELIMILVAKTVKNDSSITPINLIESILTHFPSAVFNNLLELLITVIVLISQIVLSANQNELKPCKVNNQMFEILSQFFDGKYSFELVSGYLSYNFDSKPMDHVYIKTIVNSRPIIIDSFFALSHLPSNQSNFDLQSFTASSCFAVNPQLFHSYISVSIEDRKDYFPTDLAIKFDCRILTDLNYSSFGQEEEGETLIQIIKMKLIDNPSVHMITHPVSFRVGVELTDDNHEVVIVTSREYLRLLEMDNEQSSISAVFDVCIENNQKRLFRVRVTGL